MFATITTNSYDIYSVKPGIFLDNGNGKFLVNESLVSDASFPYRPDIIIQDANGYSEVDLIHYAQHDCIDMFASSFVSDRRFAILELDRNQVLNHTDTLTLERHVDASKFFHGHDSTPYSWLCSGNGPADGPFSSIPPYCIPGKILQGSDWKVFGHNISGCYSHKYPESCKLELASQLAIVVVAITFAKVLILLLCAFIPREMPLLTMGDAISSFAANPDPHTAQMPFTQAGKRAIPWAWVFSPLLIFGLPQWRQLRVHASGVSRCAIMLLL